MFSFIRRKDPEVYSHWFVLVDQFQHSTLDFYNQIESELVARGVPRLKVSRVAFHEGGVMSHKRVYLRLARERFAFDVCASPFGDTYFFSLRFVEVPRSWMQLIILFGAMVVFGVIVLQAQNIAVFLLDHSPIAYPLMYTLIGCILGIVGVGIYVNARDRASMRKDSEALGIAEANEHMVRGTSGSNGLPRSRSAVSYSTSKSAEDILDVDGFILKLPVIGSWYERRRKNTYFRHDSRLMYQTLVSDIVKKKVDEVTAAHGVKFIKSYEYSPILGELYKSSRKELPIPEAEQLVR